MIGASLLAAVLLAVLLFAFFRQDHEKEIEIPDEEVPTGVYEDGELQVNVKDFGAVGDGVTDDTENIQRAIDYANENNIKHVILPEGHYMVSLNRLVSDRYTAISLHSNISLHLDENAVVEAIPTDQGNYAIINIVDCENVLFEGGTIIGDRFSHLGSKYSHGMGINIYNSRNVIIQKVNIRDCWGDGIYIGGRNGTQINKNILISEANISNCRRQGISVTTGEDITIRDSIIHDIKGANPQSGIDIETNWPEAPVRNVLIESNTFYNNGIQDVVLGGVCEDVKIINNVFDVNPSGTRQIAINVAYGNRVKVSGNDITDRQGAISCRHANEVEIYENRISGYEDGGTLYGVGIALIDDAANINIHDNSLQNLDKGINISGQGENVKNISITNNLIENIQVDGFYGYRPVNGLVLKGNVFRNIIMRYGILINTGNDIGISGNIIEDCGAAYIIAQVGNQILIENNVRIALFPGTHLYPAIL